jgi:alpha,alpha-trehalase
MRLPVFVMLLVGVLGLTACQQNAPSSATAASSPAPSSTAPPDEVYGALFDAVQMAKVFPDGKTFADCTPKSTPADILKKYDAEKGQPGFDLKAFVLANFDPPVAHSSGFKTDPGRTVEQHIEALWPVLTRQGDVSVSAGPGGTLLPLPKPYVVPGGRFGEVYYWDSYFTMLGLEVSGRRDLVTSMVENFAYLIDTYGHIPNGNRTYYLSRSQPPFFSLMVELLDGMDAKAGVPANERALQRFLPQLEKEYQFWMDGADQVNEQTPAHRRVVWLDQEATLNRYWDDHAAPRPESYREDVETARMAENDDKPKQDAYRPKENTYRNIKAAAESGWDFSSRWNVDRSLRDINTVQIIPVDLNCLLLHLEQVLSGAFQQKGDAAKVEFYAKRAYLRERAIRRFCWNEQAGWYEDFNWENRAQTGVLSLAGMYPLFLKMASKAEADASAKVLKTYFLRPGGVVTTANHTGQQWDAPNGWAPLQWVSVAGLRNYGHQALADDIKTRWIKLCTDVYQRTGKMLEKYNVEDLSLEAGGGEYPVQDGFGWSNGVLLRMINEVRK